MSYLDTLLQGQKVEWKTLGEVAELKRGTSITKNTANQGKYPVISGGKQPAYFIDKFNRSGETITVAGSGAYAGFVMYWNEPIFVSDAFSIKADETKVFPRYIFHFLLNIQDKIHDLQAGGGVPHVYAKDVARFQIPIPPLSVQKEIVRILDTFTELTAELTTQLRAELTARKKQYEFYREQLLRVNDEGLMNGHPVEWKTLGEVGNNKLTYGSNASAIEFDGETRYLRITDITENGNLTNAPMSPSNFEEKYLLKEGDILLARSGATVGKNFYYTENLGKAIYAGYLIRLQVNREIAHPKYIYHYLNSNDYNQFIANIKSGGSQPNINAQQYGKFKIPIPPLAEQARIVSILDKFDTLTTSISEGLPKEIELRKKQYEYYRNQLLMFNG